MTAFVAVLCLYAARLIHVEPPVHPVLFAWDLCHSVPFLLCSCVSLYVRHTTIMVGVLACQDHCKSEWACYCVTGKNTLQHVDKPQKHHVFTFAVNQPWGPARLSDILWVVPWKAHWHMLCTITEKGSSTMTTRTSDNICDQKITTICNTCQLLSRIRTEVATCSPGPKLRTRGGLSAQQSLSMMPHQ